MCNRPLFWYRVEPQRILSIIWSNAPGVLNTVRDPLCVEAVGSDRVLDAEPAHYILRALASSDFANESARERLMTVHLDTNQHVQAMVSSADEAALTVEDVDTPGTSREAWHIKSLRCGTLVNLDSHVSVRATPR